jgi:S-layer homology domain
MKRLRNLRTALALVAAALLAARSASGEEPTTIREKIRQMHESWVAAGKPRSDQASLRPKFGVDANESVNVHAYQFQANTSTDLIRDDGNGYRYFGAPAVPYMAAPVTLPPGSYFDTMTASYCSANDGDLMFTLWDNGAGGAGNILVGGPVHSFAGCGISTLGLAGNTYPAATGHPLYLVVYFAGGGWEGETRFNSVSIAFYRKVSPAPSQASFADVPTTDFGFQYIEALAASGITGGCGNGNYCPDSPISRRQMAIFLAKALGLHWWDTGPPDLR